MHARRRLRRWRGHAGVSTRALAERLQRRVGAARAHRVLANKRKKVTTTHPTQ